MLFGYPFGGRTEVAYEEDLDVEHDGTVFETLLVLVSVTPQTETKGLCPYPHVLVAMR